MSVEGRLFSNTLLLASASALSKMLSFFLLPLYTAALTPSEFGTADILVSTAVLLLPLVSLHAPEAMFRFRAGREPGALRAGFALLGIGVLLFAILLPLLGFSRVLRPYLGLLFAYVIASLLRSFLAHALRADGSFLLYAAQQMFCTVTTLVLQILFLLVWHWGVGGYLLAVVVADSLTFLILGVCLFGRWRYQGGATRALCRKMLRFSLPLLPTAMLWWIISISDRYIILHFHGESATGLYAAAGRLPTLLTFAISVFLEAWHYAALRNEREEAGALFGRIYALLCPIGVCLGSVLMIASPLLVRLFLATSYIGAGVFVPLLLFGALCGGLSNFLDSIYTLRLHSTASLLTSLSAAAANIILNFILIPTLGPIGAGIATALSYAGLFALRLWHTARYLHFPRYEREITGALLTLFAAALLYSARFPVVGALLSLLAPLVLRRHVQAAVSFMHRRTAVLLRSFLRKKKMEKKI